MKGTILVVDDNKGILSALEMLLGRYFAKVITINTPNRINESLRCNDVDIVLLDMNFSAKINTGNEGLYWLGQIKEKNPDIQVIVFTAYAEIDLAVEAIKRGATDFVVKPWENDKLIAILNNAYNLKKSKGEIRVLKELKNELVQESKMYWGTSRAMLELNEMVMKVAPTDANILITGENGTGKEMLAKEIHNFSQRRGELMVSVDIGSITETLFESELFGHVKGSFTDAKNDRAGKFEVAKEGTLFLDEIGNIPLHLQSKLLTAIQNKRIVRVGSNSPIDTNVRLICATNRDLRQMVAEEKFREDLFYRINTIHITIPPLRRRKEDIIPLAELFLKGYSNKYNKKILGLSKEAKELMLSYKWPGNIRELQHTIEKAVILEDKKEITGKKLFLTPISNSSECQGNVTQNETAVEGEADSQKNEEYTLEEMEKRMIISSINENDGNMTLVSQKLGITRQTLYNKIKKFGISI